MLMVKAAININDIYKSKMTRTYYKRFKFIRIILWVEISDSYLSHSVLDMYLY